MWFLTDCRITAESRYIWAESWEEAEQICVDENLELIGEYLETIPWFSMPEWLEP